MATANVLLAINTQVGGFANLEAMVNMVGKAGQDFKAMAVEADKMSNAMDRATIPIAEIDKRTGSLIDTVALYTEQNKLAMAGMQVTEEQYANIGVAAVELSKAIGTDATTAFKRLTKDISTGSTRSLKKLGIEIDNTEDLVLAQAEALEKLGRQFEGTSAKAETFTEQMYVLDNNIGTVTNLLISTLADDVLGAFGSSLDGVNESLGGLAETMSRRESFDVYRQGLKDLLLDMDKTGDAINLLGAAIGNLHILFTDGSDAYHRALIQDSEYLQNLGRDMRQATEDAKALREERALADEFVGPVLPGSDIRAKQKKKKTGGGSGRDKFDMEFSVDEAEDFRMSEVDEITGAAIVGASTEGKIASRDLITSQDELDAREELRNKEHDAKMKRLEEEREAMDKLTSAYEANKEAVIEANKRYRAWSMAIDMTTDAAGIMADVIIEGNKGIVKSILDALKKWGIGVAVEHGLRALAETAKGVAAQATTWGSPNPKSIAHFAAAGQHAAVAAAGGVVATGSAFIRQGVTNPKKGQGGKNSGGEWNGAMAGFDAPREQSQQRQSVDVRIGIDEDTGDIYNYVKKEDERQRRSGNGGIGEAA